VYLSLRPTAALIGAKVDRSRDGIHFSIARSRDKVLLDLGQRSFSFNGAQSNLRGEAIVRGQTVFVPIEVFHALVGDVIRSR